MYLDIDEINMAYTQVIDLITQNASNTKISMFDYVVQWFCCLVILLNVLTRQTTKQPDNKTTKQQNYFSLLIFLLPHGSGD